MVNLGRHLMWSKGGGGTLPLLFLKPVVLFRSYTCPTIHDVIPHPFAILESYICSRDKIAVETNKHLLILVSKNIR